MRLLAVEGCAALGKLLEPQDCVAHILPVIVNFSQVCLQLAVHTGLSMLFHLCATVELFPQSTLTKTVVFFCHMKSYEKQLHLVMR